jgi:hypothetical protein
MLAPDVNVLVYAHRSELPQHAIWRRWLEELVASDAAFGLPDLVLSGLLRIVTHPRVFSSPTPLADALAVVSLLRDQPNRIAIEPGPRHSSIFERLCRESRSKGNLTADA